MSTAPAESGVDQERSTASTTEVEDGFMRDDRELAAAVRAGTITPELAIEMVRGEPRLPWRAKLADRPPHYDDRHDGPVHAAFGLTYASHLVIPRLVLQSMPVAWQEDFIALIHDLHRELGDEWEPENGYGVTAKKHNGRYAENPFSDYRHGKMLRPKCYDDASRVAPVLAVDPSWSTPAAALPPIAAPPTEQADGN